MTNPFKDVKNSARLKRIHLSMTSLPDARALSVVLICGISFWTNGACGQDKSSRQSVTESPTNLNSSLLSGKENYTNAPIVLFSEKGNGPQPPASLRPFQLVLPREHLFGDWFGLLPKADQLGISPTVTFVSDVAGNITGGNSQGVTHADNLGLDLLFDLDKLAGLEGGSFLASVSQRSGSSLSEKYVGNVFTIQQVYGGQTFHLIDLAYQQRLLDDRIELRLGRIATGDDFLVSPYNWLFMQNGFDGNPVGIFFNAPGMTAYPNATWGLRLKVCPTKRTYIMGGVYNGDPSIRDIDHNGADMSMNGPVFAIAEAGYQCNGLPGDKGLIGTYRIGGWYDNSVFTEYETVGFGTTPADKRGNWGLYTLVDQVLVSFGDRSRNSGLGVCGSFLVSPDESVSQMPYFFTAGIVARGFFPSRPTDVAGFGVVYGRFSNDLRHAQERQQLLGPAIGVQDYEMVLEWTYRFYFRKGAVFFQPDLQYVIRPGGTGNIDNALVIGCQVGINF
jgi:porin